MNEPPWSRPVQRIARAQAQGHFLGFDGFLEPAGEHQCEAETVMRLGEAWVESDRMLESGNRGVVIAHHHQDPSERKITDRVLVIQGRGFLRRRKAGRKVVFWRLGIS